MNNIAVPLDDARDTPVEVLAPFRPLPWQVAPWQDKSFVVLLTGSAGGGKSRFAMEKLHGFCKRYPGATALMVRKTRESMTNSTVLQFVTEVVGGDPDVTHLESKHRFEYRNGSILAFGGMKDEGQREQVRGIGQRGGLDMCWLEEANKFSESDYQELIGRMRGKAAPWRQIILTTNPDGPTHWINARLIIGREAHVYYSHAHENPANPPAYLDSLQMLTGIQRDRLLDGKWTQAEGQVFDNFDFDRNVTVEAEYNPHNPYVIWGADDGYAQGDGPGHANYHPRVVLIGQKTPLGGLNIFDEYYKVGVSDYNVSIDAAVQLSRLPADPFPVRFIEYAAIDSSAAMFVGALWKRGIQSLRSTHTVSEGIRNVRRLLCDANGVALIRIHPRCKELIRELQMYRYDTADVSAGGEPRPLKIDDHGPDALRYMTWVMRWNK